MGGECVDAPAGGAGACVGLAMCATGCSSLADDPRNCGACGQPCDGVCNGGACMAPGNGPFGAACASNGDCQGGLCLDQVRFGFPKGFCSSVCDADRPCPGPNQTCVVSPTSGAYGTCRPECETDAECGGTGLLCVNGACQPDCRTGPACSKDEACDPTGRCVAMAPSQICAQPQVTCLAPGGGGTYCAEPSKDPANCGGCGRVCPPGDVCDAGVCAPQTCASGTTACVSAAGAFCANLQADSANCGACGNVCPGNAICAGGACQGGGGTYPGLAVCTAGTAPFCANLLGDPSNCGKCGTVCPQGQRCFSGTCGTSPPPPTCPTGATVCADPSGQKQSCSDLMYDAGNCGKCGNACGANMGCMNGVCVPAGSPTDAGTVQCEPPSMPCQNAAGVFCTNISGDPGNCGGCGVACPTGICSDGVCQGAFDGGVAPPKCSAGLVSCLPAEGAGYCADPMKDPNNCGACFKACPGGYVCSGGVCATSDGGLPP
jgi:hypothetical protein